MSKEETPPLILISLMLASGDYLFATLQGESAHAVRVMYPFFFDMWDEDEGDEDDEIDPASFACAPFDKYGSNEIVDIMKTQIVACTRLSPAFCAVYKAIVDTFIKSQQAGQKVETITKEEVLSGKKLEEPEKPIYISAETKSILSSIFNKPI